MNQALKEILCFVGVGVGFGTIWALIQIINGQITGLGPALGPVFLFGFTGLIMWVLRKTYIYFRAR